MKKSKLLGLVALASLGLNANAQDLQAGKYYIQNVECGKYIASGAAWGTRSVLFDEGVEFNVTLENGVYTLGTRIVADNRALRPTDGFMDQSGTWEVIPNGNGTFKVKGSNGYLKYDGSSLPSVSGGSTDAGTDWRFLSKEDREALLDGASETNPKDATFYITAPDFLWEDCRIKTDRCWGSVLTGTNGLHSSGTTEINNTNGEMYDKAVGSKLVQTLTGVRNGKYKVSCLAFYRAGSAVAAYGGYDAESQKDAYQYAQLFANDEKTPIKSVFVGAKATAGNGYAYNSNGQIPVFVPNGQGDAAICFMDNTYLNELEVIVTDNQLTLGIEKTGHVGSDWCLFDSFRLTYLGAVTDLSAYKPGYDKAVADATGVDQNAPMNASVLSDLKSALSTYNVDFSTFSSADDISAAIKALNGATTAAIASIDAYAAVASKFSAFDADGQAAFLATEVGQKYANKTYVDEDCTSAIVTAAKAQTTAGADMTLAIVNPNFDGNINGWTDGFVGVSGLNHGFQNNNVYGSINQFMECWAGQWSGASTPYVLKNGYLSQTITALPAGKYRISADVIACNQQVGQTGYVASVDDFTGVYLFAGNTVSEALKTDGSNAQRFSLDFTATGADVEIGLKIKDSNCNWAVIDNVTLTLVKAGIELDTYAEQLAKAVESAEEFVGKNMQASVATNLTKAIADGKKTYNTADEYVAVTNAVNSAKSAAETSIALYNEIAAINAKVAALSADVQAQYASTLAAYNAGTLSSVAEAEAAYYAACYAAVTSLGDDVEIVNPSFETGDLTGWVCNNGSDTGSKDNSNATYTMAGCDGAKLFNTWNGGTCASVTQTITGLKAGKYAVVATMATDADHELYVSVNNGTRGTVTSVGKGEGVVVSAEGEIALGSNELTIEAGSDGIWYKADNFKLVLIEEYVAPVIADLTVNDGVAVEASQDAKNITYVREFKAANKWQSLYLPFSVSLENNEADVVLAKIDDVIEDNGELVIKIIKVSKYETVVARRPLFIAAKTVGVKNIKTGVSTIDEPLDGGYDYSAAEFIGVLSKASAGQAGRYVMSGGELCLVPQSMNNLTLGVNRWAMYVNDGSSVRIRINAEGFNADEATAIASAVAESVENGEIFSINGAKVKDAKSGLYIKGGKKVYVK